MPTENIITDIRDIAAETAIRPEEPLSPEQPQKDVPGFLALKFTFAPSRGDMGGAFCVIFDGQTGKTVFQVFWLAKPYGGRVIIEPSKDWRNFVKRLPQLGPLDKEWCDKLQMQLKEILTNEEKRSLFENYTRPKLRQLESIIRRNFEQTSQCVFSAATDAEPVARAELERAKVLKPLGPTPEELARKKREQEEREQEELEDEERRKKAKIDGKFEGTLIKCTPVLDPVNGKASSDVMPGDIIGVGIEGDGTSALVKKFLDENNIEPLFPVDEVKRGDGRTFIYVKISDEIRGIVTITKDLKIKVKQQQQPENKTVSFSFFGDILFFGVLGIALIGLLFVIRYFFL